MASLPSLPPLYNSASGPTTSFEAAYVRRINKVCCSSLPFIFGRLAAPHLCGWPRSTAYSLQAPRPRAPLIDDAVFILWLCRSSALAKLSQRVAGGGGGAGMGGGGHANNPTFMFQVRRAQNKKPFSKWLLLLLLGSSSQSPDFILPVSLPPADPRSLSRSRCLPRSPTSRKTSGRAPSSSRPSPCSASSSPASASRLRRRRRACGREAAARRRLVVCEVGGGAAAAGRIWRTASVRWSQRRWLSFLFSLLREGALNRDLRSPRVYTVIFERRGVCIYGGP